MKYPNVYRKSKKLTADGYAYLKLISCVLLQNLCSSIKPFTSLQARMLNYCMMSSEDSVAQYRVGLTHALYLLLNL